MNIKNLTVPALIGLSLLFGACAEQKIEAPDASGVQEGIEQSAEDANDAIQSGMDNVKQGAEDVTDAAGKAVKDLENKIPQTNNN